MNTEIHGLCWNTNGHESTRMSTNLFFELLQVALGTRDGLSRVPNTREWEKMYEEAERQAVVGVMLGGLERLPQEQLPPLELKLQWIGMVQMMEAEYKMHCERAAELTRRFRNVGFKSCVLKGIGMAQYYPKPSRRQCGDIDIWVSGRRKDVMSYLRSEYKVSHVVWHHVGTEVFDDVQVEVHFHPAWVYGPLRNRKLQRFFDCELRVLRESNLGFNVPLVGFDAVFSLVHTYHHLLEEGVGLRHIVDYYYIIQALPSKDRSETMQTLKDIGLGKFTSAMMWVLNEVCGLPASELLCEPDEKAGKFLLNDVMVSGNFGFYRNDNKGRNTLRRYVAMLPHYPREVPWMVPWKVWHRIWMFFQS